MTIRTLIDRMFRHLWREEEEHVVDTEAQYAVEGHRFDPMRPSPEEALYSGPGLVFTADKGWVEFSTANDPTTFDHE